MQIDIAPDYDNLADFIATIPDSFDRMGQLIYDGRNTLRRITAPDGRQIVVKRYKRPNPIQRVVYAITPSKARKAVNAARRLADAGFITPAPIASIEQRRHGLMDRYYFISEPTDATSLYPLLAETDHPSQELIDAVAHLVYSLHRAGILHGDLNLNNILLTPSDTTHPDNGALSNAYRPDNVSPSDPTHPDDGVPYDTNRPDNIAPSDTSAYNDKRFVLIDTNRSRFTDGLPTDRRCLANLMRLTHKRPLLRRIATAYARLRGWNPDRTATRLLRLLTRFEHRRTLRHLLRP